MTRIAVIHGPNLNLLGTREPELYGTMTLEDLNRAIAGWAKKLGAEVSFLQSNHEGEIIDAIHGASGSDGIVINPGAYTHTSRAIPDAILAIGVPAVEVHISNVKEREPWRAQSTLEGVVVYTIYGRGVTGYRDALRHLVNRSFPSQTVSYGPSPENVGEVRGDLSAADLLVMVVHRGFWLGHWTRDTTESLAIDLARRGKATWNIEYRRFGSGGGWPGSAQDVKTALGYVPHFWDGEVVVMGHSAGGHMALWAGLESEIRGVVGLAAVTDLEALLEARGPGAPSARRLLEEGAPAALNAPRGTALFHGREDDQVEVEQSSRLEDQATVHLFDGLSHFQLLDPGRDHWRAVLEYLG